jgi:hypothetical protein
MDVEGSGPGLIWIIILWYVHRNRKPSKDVSQDSKYLGRDSNRARLEYKLDALPLNLSVIFFCFTQFTVSVYCLDDMCLHFVGDFITKDSIVPNIVNEGLEYPWGLARE